jgi:FdhD protein
MNLPPDEATVSSRVQTFADGTPDRDRIDCIAVEASLEVRIGGKPVTVLMRTPGHDEELVRGFLSSDEQHSTVCN